MIFKFWSLFFSWHPSNFDSLYFNFHIFQNYFYLSWSPMSRLLDVSCWISEHSGTFPAVFLFLVSGLAPLQSRRYRAATWWMWLVSLGRTYVLLLFDEVIHSCHLYSFDLWDYGVHLGSYRFSACWICLFMTEGCWSYRLLQWIPPFLLEVQYILELNYSAHYWTFDPLIIL